MVNEQIIWSIFIIPIVAFLFISLIIRPFLNRYSFISGPIAILAIGISFILSLLVFNEIILSHNADLVYEPKTWLEIGKLKLTIGLLLDPLTAIMLVAVTGVSLMVQIYSTGYMRAPARSSHDDSHHDTESLSHAQELGQPVYARYFAYMSLFTASMLGLVMASNIIQLFVFWELVGLCSYLLIGFWFQRPSAAAAAKKAFIVTRVGDVGLLLAIMYLFAKTMGVESNANYLEIATINNYLPNAVSSLTLTLITIGIFIGAVGKSGQFPLHTWLPDAMEGPTPVSALIHAATMVTAGVFLVGRFFPIFEESSSSMAIVTLIGGVTALFAATMALVSNDIKRVLAYSTISQLGYMMLSLGIGAYAAAIFHLFTHAFFKALLFLGSGSINHATGTFDMRFMGGLRKKMPVTYLTFLIASLSLAGIFPLAGFWSKDEILLNAYGSGFVNNEFIGIIVFFLAMITVFMTGFYMFRVLFLTFEGDFRGGSEKDPEAHPHGPIHLAESPLVMVLPMIILVIPAIIIGFLANPIVGFAGLDAHWMGESLKTTLPEGIKGYVLKDFNTALALISSLIGLSGIILAYFMYKPNPGISPQSVGNIFQPIHNILYRKYYVDELYEDLLVRKLYYGWIARILDWTDRNIVDRTASIIGWIGANTGTLLRQFQNGQTQTYATVSSIGIIVIIVVYLLRN